MEYGSFNHVMSVGVWLQLHCWKKKPHLFGMLQITTISRLKQSSNGVSDEGIQLFKKEKSQFQL